MKIKIISVTGKRNQFNGEIDRYIKMLPSFMKVEQLELSISKRSKQKTVHQNLKDESEKILRLRFWELAVSINGQIVEP